MKKKKLEIEIRDNRELTDVELEERLMVIGMKMAMAFQGELESSEDYVGILEFIGEAYDVIKFLEERESVEGDVC